MFIKEYGLNQHSILIHFQVNQSENGLNVCLRPTEVKPKLDRFIVKKLGGRAGVIDEHKDWIRAENPNGVDLALNYKMSIRCNSQNVTVYKTKNRNDNDDTPKLPDIYYGNMGDNVEKKYGVFFNDGLTIRIVCFNDELGKVIDQYIAEFFAVTNFGTMQDKGFGSFTIQGCDINIPKVLKENYGANACYMIRTNQKGYSDAVQNELFKTIKQVYSIMKSGQNIVGRDGRTITSKYIRSYIYVYMHEKHKLGNEKACLKKNGVAPIRTTHDIANAHEHDKQADLTEFRYVRALLGIGENVEWLDEDPDSRRREKVTIEDQTQELGIERFASPVFFKIVNGRIYMTANQPDSRIFGHSFRFANQGYTRGNPNSERKGKSVMITTLTEDEGMHFDMTDFLNSFMKYYNDNLQKLRIKYKLEVAR